MTYCTSARYRDVEEVSAEGPVRSDDLDVGAQLIVVQRVARRQSDVMQLRQPTTASCTYSCYLDLSLDLLSMTYSCVPGSVDHDVLVRTWIG